jgi:hypothetical protein
MCFFLRKNLLQDFKGCGILRGDEGDHCAIGVDHDPCGNQVFRNHLPQGLPFFSADYISFRYLGSPLSCLHDGGRIEVQPLLH